MRSTGYFLFDAFVHFSLLRLRVLLQLNSVYTKHEPSRSGCASTSLCLLDEGPAIVGIRFEIYVGV